MMTPQEVSQHAFAKASFGGYNMAMVDEFLDQLTEDYTALYKENALLKSKMKVLVEKVEEYRSTEEGMRKALLAAQRTADEIVREAEEKRDRLIGTAEGEARAKIDGLRQELENEQMRLNAAKESTAAYVAKLKELYQHEMDYLNSLSQMTAPAPSQTDQTARDIQSSMEKIVEEETGELPKVEDEEPQDEPEQDSGEDDSQEDGGLYAELLGMDRKDKEEQPEQPERREHRDHRGDRRARRRDEDEEDEDDSPTRRIDFSNLKFGKDYEIK
ncbi:DivIVA domain-containing protein [Pseudoflavonifractor sp. CLA-AP-H29]|uniref:DivIVA domain-containing protein n=1 Tax=Pseudoflavonifractor intestinihominis TaxID=3133171 RepID=A0ABV1E7S9_9FIRM